MASSNDDYGAGNPIHDSFSEDGSTIIGINRSTFHVEEARNGISSDVPLRFSSMTSIPFRMSSVPIRQSSYAPILPVNSKYMSTFMLVNYMIGMKFPCY